MTTRVLRVITRLNIGGPAIHVGVLAAGLDGATFDTLLVAGRPSPIEGDMTQQVLAARVPVVRLRWLQRAIHPFKDLAVWWQLTRLIRRRRPHIVHTHMAKAGALGRSAAWWVRCLDRTYRPLVIHTFHGHVLDGYFAPWQTRCFTAIERWLARRTSHLIAVSPAVKADLVARSIAPPDRIHVIALGLPLAAHLRVDGRRHVWRSREAGEFHVVWAGRLVPIKQPAWLLDAVHQLGRRWPAGRVRVTIAGDGELRQAVERQVQALGLQDRVRCVGWVEDMAALYADADVVCLTSRNEGTPVSLIEAMAAGRPVVATAVGGVPDVLQTTPGQLETLASGAFLRGTGGLVARAGDVEGLAAALMACATDPALRQALGREGREHVRERYAAARLVRDIERCYHTWLGMEVAAAPGTRQTVICAS